MPELYKSTVKLFRSWSVVWLALSLPLSARAEMISLDSAKLSRLQRQAIENIARNPGEALRMAEESIDMAKEMGDTIAMVRGNSIIGSIYNDQGAFDKALERLYQSLEICEMASHVKGISTTHNHIGDVYNSLGNFEEALNNYQIGFEVDSSISDWKDSALYYNNVATIYHKQQQFESALDFYQQAITFYQKHDRPDKQTIVLFNIGLVYLKTNALDSALGCFQTALVEFGRQNNLHGLANVNNAIGFYYFKNAAFVKSSNYYRRGLGWAKEAHYATAEKTAYEMLSKVYAAMARYEQAYEYQLLFQHISDSLLGESTTRQLTQMEMKHEFDLIQKEQQVEQQRKDLAYRSELRKEKNLRNIAVLLTVLFLIIVGILWQSYRVKHKKNKKLALQNKIIAQQRQEIISEKERSDQLISEMLPAKEASVIEKDGASLQHYELLHSVFLKLQDENIKNQLQSLKGELSPHFLFNSFDTLIDAIEENQGEAIEYAREMANIMKYVLQNKKKELIELGEELDFINSYMGLLHKRFGNDVLIKQNLPGDINNRYLPVLSLQLLIENAVKHNIVSAEKPLIINIGCEKHNAGKIFLTVRNNLQPKTSVVNSTKIGLGNIKNRYKFHAGADVIIEKGETHFTAKLPLLEV